MNKVSRAIIMCAGLGKRMQPITLDTPKPLVKVNGVPMVETVINGLHEKDIYEIHIVVGYLAEQFAYLAEKYEGIDIISNPLYAECNNISSLYFARNYIGEAIILDGDQIILNSECLKTEYEKSGYSAVWTDDITEEWLMEVEDNTVKACSRTGGEHGWQLYSISRWTKEDGLKLKKYVEEEFESGNRQIYWDDVAMFCHFDQFDLGIVPMSKGDILEIDSIEELIAIDSSYEIYMREI